MTKREQPPFTVIDLPAIKTVAKKIKIPINQWPGNCYGIADAIVKAGIIPGRAVYGHYMGPQNPDGLFGDSFTQHGWIRTDYGAIVDPTRWVFECSWPHLWLGPVDHPDYDEGGQLLRVTFDPIQMPDFNPSEQTTKLTFTESIGSALEYRYPIMGSARPSQDPKKKRTYTLCASQLFWLAKRPPSELGDTAKYVYQVMDEHNAKGLIPIDNWRTVMEG
jgi:hypothetical protein